MTLNDLVHISSGKFISQKPWIHPKRNIDSCEVLFVISGNFEICEADKVYSLAPNQVLFLDKNTTHAGISEQSNISFFWAHFPAYPDNIVLPKTLVLSNATNVLLLFRQLLHYNNTPEYPQITSDLLLRLILTEINVQYLRIHDEHHALVNEIREWIRINSNRPITAKDVSDHFKYNKDYLSRLFKKANLPGLKQTIIQTKLNQARYLLLSSNLSIKEVAFHVGFDNYIEFLKFFKYHEGVSPTDFRNTYSQIHLNNC